MNATVRHERSQPLPGQTLVLFALMSLLLLAGLGLIFDAGLDYSNRRTMQNAADIAALRGARVIAQQAVYADDSPAVWAYVDKEVKDTAQANGVPERDKVICHFLTDALVATPCNDGPVPANVTGVWVRVSEIHTPIVMRALGIMTSGTAATAAAQVQMVDTLSGDDFPFMVCGVDTAVVGGGQEDILKTSLFTDTEPGPSPSPMTYKEVDSPYGILDSAYSYDWNERKLDGDFKDLGGPQFIIYGDEIQGCGDPNWKGLADVSGGNFILPYGDYDTLVPMTFGDFIPLVKPPGYIGDARATSPVRSINAPQGCTATTSGAAAYRTDCVMLLPIGNTGAACPTQCYYETAEDRAGGTFFARRWGAFFVKYDSDNDQYWGRLIKNYPMHTNGEPGWDPHTYVGPLNITLIQTP